MFGLDLNVSFSVIIYKLCMQFVFMYVYVGERVGMDLMFYYLL